MKCCICGKEISGYGNNPDGAAWLDENKNVVFPTLTEKDRCCDQCNEEYVIPGRLYRLKAKHNSKPIMS